MSGIKLEPCPICGSVFPDIKVEGEKLYTIWKSRLTCKKCGFCVESKNEMRIKAIEESFVKWKDGNVIEHQEEE